MTDDKKQQASDKNCICTVKSGFVSTPENSYRTKSYSTWIDEFALQIHYKPVLLVNIAALCTFHSMNRTKMQSFGV